MLFLYLLFAIIKSQDISNTVAILNLNINGKKPNNNYNNYTYQDIDIYTSRHEEYGYLTDMWSLLIPDSIPKNNYADLSTCVLSLYVIGASTSSS